MRQLRAEQTRHALIAAAAAEFDRHGYAGTSLSRICKAAGTTMGALTFHFPTKGDLAEAVRAAGDAAALAALRPIAAVPHPGVQVVIDLTIELARLLERDVTVRAAGRLVREGTADPAQRPAGWVRVLRDLLERARSEADGIRVPCDSDLRDMELLVAYLMAGAEASVRSGAAGGSVSQELRDLWAFLTCGGLHTALAGNTVLAGESPLTESAVLPGESPLTENAVLTLTGEPELAEDGFPADGSLAGNACHAEDRTPVESSSVAERDSPAEDSLLAGDSLRARADILATDSFRAGDSASAGNPERSR
ncbi:TetR family transcriptional regulator [Streptomyces sp. NPDC002599]|uniref:TetR family transcriptional regulator n=1 Tax=Streptomyces sp. NPDC002599 TaxID=3154421 RepID=UPI00331F780A